MILAKVKGDYFKPQMVAGHSLGEFSALVSAGYLSFEDGSPPHKFFLKPMIGFSDSYATLP